MGIIKARQLVHEYIRRDEEGNVESISTALDHVDLDVEAGDFIAILGHNGSGKSTLAKHINALLLPSEGSLWVDGRDVTKEENTFAVIGATIADNFQVKMPEGTIGHSILDKLI